MVCVQGVQSTLVRSWLRILGQEWVKMSLWLLLTGRPLGHVPSLHPPPILLWHLLSAWPMHFQTGNVSLLVLERCTHTCLQLMLPVHSSWDSPTLTSYSPSWCWQLPEIISYMDSLSPGGQVLVRSATVAFSELKIKPRTWQRELSICWVNKDLRRHLFAFSNSELSPS